MTTNDAEARDAAQAADPLALRSNDLLGPWSIPNHPEPCMTWTTSEVACILAWARRLLADERERCAQVADAHAVPCGKWGSENADIYRAQEAWAEAIAKSIRQLRA